MRALKSKGVSRDRKRGFKCRNNGHRGTKQGTKDIEIGLKGKGNKGIKGKEKSFRNRKEE